MQAVANDRLLDRPELGPSGQRVPPDYIARLLPPAAAGRLAAAARAARGLEPESLPRQRVIRAAIDAVRREWPEWFRRG